MTIPLELCGGTHVHALGFIGPIKIVSESSIGANLRRIEAVTGAAALDRIRAEEQTLRRAASALRVKPDELPERIERLRDELKTLQGQLGAERARQATVEAAGLAAEAHDRVAVARRDGRSVDELRQLALAVARRARVGVVGLVGTGPDPSKAVLAVAVSRDLVEHGVHAGSIAKPGAGVLGGGTGSGADVAVGGGPNAAAIDDARAALDREAHDAVGAADAT